MFKGLTDWNIYLLIFDLLHYLRCLSKLCYHILLWIIHVIFENGIDFFWLMLWLDTKYTGQCVILCFILVTRYFFMLWCFFIYIYIYAFSRCFYPNQYIHVIHFLSVCLLVSWFINVCVLLFGVVYGCNVNFVFSFIFCRECDALWDPPRISRGVNPNTNHIVRHLLG